MLIPVDTALAASPVVLLAYVVFGLTGFGAAMVAVPILIQFMPLQQAVPLVVLFDLVCTALVGGRNWRQVSRQEMRALFPWMLIGIAAGTTLLHNVGPRWPLVALGVFVLFVCVRNLLTKAGTPRPPWAPMWSVPFGAVGGVFSALFGTGGPIYTIYLSHRLPHADQFRATISVVILISGVIRAATFASSGLYARDGLLMLALVLIPVALIGLFLGSRARRWIGPAFTGRAILVLLAVSGIGAIYRGLMSAA